MGGRLSTVGTMISTLPSKTELELFKGLKSVDDIAAFLGTTFRRLSFHLYSIRRPSYRTFKIAKASGGTRLIASPPPVIAIFQKKLLQCMTEIVHPKDPCHGFSKGRSIVTNAKQHVQKHLVLNIDLLDFFPSFHFGRVRGVFQNRPFDFSPSVAAVLAQICCFDGRLPQGGHTSPIISNLICRGLDRDLERLARKSKCRYTRYADDITFSTNRQEFSPNIVATIPTSSISDLVLGTELLKIIANHDLRLNQGKTRLRHPNERQEVTGLVTNEKVNVPRKFIRNVRAIIYNCETKGVRNENNRFKQQMDRKQRRDQPPHLLEHLKGKLEYLRMVRGGDDHIYARLYLRAQPLSHIFSRHLTIWGGLAKPEFLAHAIWIVLGLDKDGIDISQGTAFNLAGVGIISASHVFKNPASDGDRVASWQLISAADHKLQYYVKNIKEIQGLDLAIVQSPQASLRAVLCQAADEPSPRDPVTVVGFPNWNTIADELSITTSNVSQLRTISGVRYILTNASIRTGNSGGPLLDSRGKVVGVALYNSESSIAPNGGIAIRHIKDLVSGVTGNSNL
ncbi:MAG: reverse transcriptase domain-containing protein [Thermoanaerobaculia bacterium]